MLSKRLWTAFIGIPLFILLIFNASSYLFFLAVLIVAMVGQNEFYLLLEEEELRLQRFTGLLMGAFLLRAIYSHPASGTAAVMVLALLIIIILRVFSGRDAAHAVKEMGVTLFGFIYVSFLLGYLILIRNHEDGQAWIFFLFLSVWAGDAGAYLIGSVAGKHPLYRSISPNKTIEGAVGGLVCSFAASVIAWFLLFSSDYKLIQLVLLGLVLGLAGQIGDLSESLIKRSAGSKDSGVLFPGHGGVLDRFDSILFASPVLYYLVI